MKWRFFIGLCLLSQVLDAQSAERQNLAWHFLFSDSWSSAQSWFSAENYTTQDAFYLPLTGFSTLAIMANDRATGEWIRPQQTRTNFATHLGEFYGNPLKMGLVGVGAYAATYAFGSSSGMKMSALALQSMLTAGALTMALKLTFHRHRPRERGDLNPYIFDGPSLSGDQLSFPSGHSTIAFAVASSLSAYLDDRWYYAVPLYGLAGLTAWQRVYQFEHWPSDVFLGAAIGTWVGRKLAQRMKEKTKSNAWLPEVQAAPWGAALSWKLD